MKIIIDGSDYREIAEIRIALVLKWFNGLMVVSSNCYLVSFIHASNTRLMSEINCRFAASTKISPQVPS